LYIIQSTHSFVRTQISAHEYDLSCSSGAEEACFFPGSGGGVDDVAGLEGTVVETVAATHHVQAFGGFVVVEADDAVVGQRRRRLQRRHFARPVEIRHQIVTAFRGLQDSSQSISCSTFFHHECSCRCK